MLLRGHKQFSVEVMGPYFLHVVVPVSDNAILNWILQSEDIPLVLVFVTHVRVLLIHAHHDVLELE